MQNKGSYNVIPSMLSFDFIRINNISKAKINNKFEVGSTWRASLPSEKYFVVVPPLIKQDSWSFGKIFTH